MNRFHHPSCSPAVRQAAARFALAAAIPRGRPRRWRGRPDCPPPHLGKAPRSAQHRARLANLVLRHWWAEAGAHMWAMLKFRRNWAWHGHGIKRAFQKRHERDPNGNN